MIDISVVANRFVNINKIDRNDFGDTHFSDRPLTLITSYHFSNHSLTLMFIFATVFLVNHNDPRNSVLARSCDR